ncbi:MAG TPA: hypothetical protein VNT52_14280 [Acidimicrobiales bacterium]|nr:hypothetical protein [Acidimicrobiales bacterium]
MLTKRGWALTVGGIVLAVAGRLLGLLELYVLAAGCWALMAMALAFVALRPADIAARRTLTPHSVRAGDEARVELALQNRGRRATPVVELRDPVDGGPRRARILIAPLPAGASERAHYRIPTERRGVISVGPLESRRFDPLALPRDVVLADGQLVAAGGGGPVDLAEVVAHHPRAEGVEVFAGGADGGGLPEPAPAVVAGGVGEGKERFDERKDHELRRRRPRRRPGGQGQGVEAPRFQGTDRDHAPALGGDAVVGPLAGAGGEGGDQDARPARTAVDGVTQLDDRGRPPAPVPERQLDPRLVAGPDAVRGDGAAGGDVGRAQGQECQGHCHQGPAAGGQHVQLEQAEQPAGDGQDDPADGERPPALGQHAATSQRGWPRWPGRRGARRPG